MKKLYVLSMLLLLMILAACSGNAATETAPTNEAEVTEETTREVRPTAVPTETAVPAATGAVADVLPCNATMVTDQGSLLRVIHRVPDSTSPVVGARRAGQAFTITAVQTDATGVTWYNVSEANLTVGWLEPQYVVLSADCVSGGAGAEATVEVTEAESEATAEATAE